MGNSFQFYVKSTSNYLQGYPLTTFEQLSPPWTGESIELPFGEEGRETIFPVVGWTSLFGGSADTVRIEKVRIEDREGYLVSGGDSGVRILDEYADVTEWIDDHLPAGYGLPFVWVDNLGDFPEEVQHIVSQLLTD